jgi:OsmC-like protein
MNPDELRAMQAPLKQRYRMQPDSALITLTARSRIDEGITCKVETGRALVQAGLHPATGGDGLSACSGDMLLEALVACAGVTLRAVATALGIDLRDATITAEGDLDFRGTLGVAKDAQSGSRRSAWASTWTPPRATSRSRRSNDSPSAIALCSRR